MNKTISSNMLAEKLGLKHDQLMRKVRTTLERHPKVCQSLFHLAQYEKNGKILPCYGILPDGLRVIRDYLTKKDSDTEAVEALRDILVDLETPDADLSAVKTEEVEAEETAQTNKVNAMLANPNAPKELYAAGIRLIALAFDILNAQKEAQANG